MAGVVRIPGDHWLALNYSRIKAACARPTCCRGTAKTVRERVRKTGVANPSLFGRVLHGDDREDSDLDIHVEPGPGTSLLDLAGLQLQADIAAALKEFNPTPPPPPAPKAP